MIEASIRNLGEVADRFATLPEAARAAMERAADQIALDLLAEADRNLSGRVLQERSGALRASLRCKVETGAGLAVTLRSDSLYAAYHEVGFHGLERVREHLRTQLTAFGRPMAPKPVRVRAFDRRIDYSGRLFLRPAVESVAPAARSLVAEALRQALQQ